MPEFEWQLRLLYARMSLPLAGERVEINSMLLGGNQEIFCEAVTLETHPCSVG